MDLTTLTLVKSLMALEVTDDQHDAVLSRLISSYSATFENYLCRPTLIASRTEVHRVKQGQRMVSLYAAPMTASPTSVKVGISRDFTSETALTEDSDYVVDLDRAQIEFLYVIQSKVAYAQVVYTAGMAADTASFIAAYPAIAEACALQVAYHYKRKDFPAGQHVVEGGSTNFVEPLGLLGTVKSALDCYRRAWI